jgi:hypothetical protein
MHDRSDAMVRNKLAAAMAGAALVVALHGGTASADDGSRDPNITVERQNGGTFLCTRFSGTVWLDTDGNGVLDTHYYWPCFGATYTLSF